MKMNTKNTPLMKSDCQQLHQTNAVTLPPLLKTTQELAQNYSPYSMSLSGISNSVSCAQNSVNSNLKPADLSNHNKVSITSVQDLDKLRNEDILLALSNPEKLEELVNSCHGKQIEIFHNRRKELGKQLETLARSNLAKSKNLEERKAQILEKCAEYQATLAKLDNHTKDLEEKSRSIADLEIMFDSMRVITMEAEDKSDSVAKSFLEGKTSTEDFLNTFQELRKLFHTRTMKCHRLNEHLCYGVPL